MARLSLKDQSRLSVFNVTSANVSLTTTLGWPRFCDVIGQRHEMDYKRNGLAYPKLFNEMDETAPLRPNKMVVLHWQTSRWRG